MIIEDGASTRRSMPAAPVAGASATTSPGPVIWAVPALCTGLAVLVIGTFLPWLHSGRVTRNSYVADGLLRRVLDFPAALDALLAIWPYLSIACAAAAALSLVGLRRTGGALAALCALVAGGVAASMLAAHVSGTVRPAGAGPAVTLGGATLILLTIALASSRALLTSTMLSRPSRRS